MCILCVCVKINKHSFEPFRVWIPLHTSLKRETQKQKGVLAGVTYPTEYKPEDVRHKNRRVYWCHLPH